MDYTEIEIEWMKEILRDKEKEIKKLNERIKELEQCNLNLQEWLDNKEKVNKSMREELEWYHWFDNYLTNHWFDMKNLKENINQI